MRGSRQSRRGTVTKIGPVRAFVCGQYNQSDEAAGVVFVCEELSRQLEESGWPTVRASAMQSRAGRVIDVVWKSLRARRNYDVAIVEVYSGGAFLLSWLYALVFRSLRCPVVLSLHGGALPAMARSRPRLVRGLLNGAAVVTTPSLVTQDAMRDVSVVTAYVPNGINVPSYEYVQRTMARPRLVWLRAFHRVYDPMMAVEVVNILRREFPDVTLVMYGPDRNDGTLEAVKAYVSEMDLARHVEIRGPVRKADVPQRLQEHDIILNTTSIESFGIGVMEAAACGLIVVTRAVGELPRLWRDGKTAKLVQERSPQQMADVVAGLLRDAEEARCLSAGARATAVEYDWSRVLPRWHRVLIDASRGERSGEERRAPCRQRTPDRWDRET